MPRARSMQGLNRQRGNLMNSDKTDCVPMTEYIIGNEVSMSLLGRPRSLQITGKHVYPDERLTMVSD